VTGVPALLVKHHVLDVRGRAEIADAADHHLLIAVAQEAAADVDVGSDSAVRTSSSVSP